MEDTFYDCPDCGLRLTGLFVESKGLDDYCPRCDRVKFENFWKKTIPRQLWRPGTSV